MKFVLLLGFAFNFYGAGKLLISAWTTMRGLAQAPKDYLECGAGSWAALPLHGHLSSERVLWLRNICNRQSSPVFR